MGYYHWWNQTDAKYLNQYFKQILYFLKGNAGIKESWWRSLSNWIGASMKQIYWKIFKRNILLVKRKCWWRSLSNWIGASPLSCHSENWRSLCGWICLPPFTFYKRTDMLKCWLTKYSAKYSELFMTNIWIFFGSIRIWSLRAPHFPPLSGFQLFPENNLNSWTDFLKRTKAFPLVLFRKNKAVNG